jgi:hypothetical protein
MARIPMRTISVPAWWTDQADGTPMLIELTAKRWKALTLISAALLVLGLVILSWQMWVEVYRPILDLDQPRGAFAPLDQFREAMGGAGGIVGWLFVLVAAALGLYARFMAWWRHG